MDVHSEHFGEVGTCVTNCPEFDLTGLSLADYIKNFYQRRVSFWMKIFKLTQYSMKIVYDIAGEKNFKECFSNTDVLNGSFEEVKKDAEEWKENKKWSECLERSYIHNINP